MSPIADDKKVLRALARARRDAVPDALRAQHSAAIVGHLQLWLEAHPKLRTIALYAAMGSEVDLAALTQWCMATQRMVLMPKVEGLRKALAFVRIDGQTTWTRASGRFLQPTGKPFTDGVLDVVLVPGLLFDAAGYRLGYGGGYYDQTLLHTAAVRIGVSYAMQRTSCVPKEAHDIRLDGLVDETGLHASANTGRQTIAI